MQPATNGNLIKPTPPKPAPKPSRMALATNVIRGRLAKPIRALVFGVEGVGKSTFAAGAPAPIFLCAESGTSELDVDRFPEPTTWAEVFEAIDELGTTDHKYQTLVIDTLDWIEPMCWQVVCDKPDDKGVRHENIESRGYGKGYNIAVDEWRKLLARLERLRNVKGMHIVMLAHSWIKSFKNPEGDDFDRYEMKLNNKAAGLLKEWCDVVMFANYEILVAKKSNKTRGVDSDARLLHTQRRAAWDAKNRYDLPESLSLDWTTFFEAAKAHRPGEPANFRARISELLAAVTDATLAERVSGAVAGAGDDAAKLAKILDHLSGTLQTKENAQ